MSLVDSFVERLLDVGLSRRPVASDDRVQSSHTNMPRVLSLHAYMHTAIDMAKAIKTPRAPGPPSAAMKLVAYACTSVCRTESPKEHAKRGNALFRSRNIEMAPARFRAAVRLVDDRETPEIGGLLRRNGDRARKNEK